MTKTFRLNLYWHTVQCIKENAAGNDGKGHQSEWHM